jgi:VWFA-related protein
MRRMVFSLRQKVGCNQFILVSLLRLLVRQGFRVARSHLGMPPMWLAFVLLLSITLPAQQNSAPQKPVESPLPTNESAPIPTYKSRSDLVLVPVVVRDHKGKHMAGLSKDVFHLEENGKEQNISLFEEVQAPETAPAPALDRSYSNLPFEDSRQTITIIVLDLLNTSTFQREDGKEQIVKFLSKGLAPNQPVSLVCMTSKGLKPVYPVTSDTNSMIQVLRKTSLGAETIMAGQGRGANTPFPYRESLVLSTIGQIEEIARAYVGIPGRKSLIFAAGAIPELATESQIWDPSVYTGNLREMWHSLIEANISVYPVHLLDWSRNLARRGPVGSLDVTLRQFANSTGGNLCNEENGLMSCLSEAVNDSRSYYMLGFSVLPDDRKPGWRYLKVTVSAEHANVRARNGFYYGTPPVEVPKHSQEINALASPLPQSALPMYVRVVSSSPNAAPPPAGKTTVAFLMTIPLNGVVVDPSQKNPLDLEVGAIALTSDTKEAGEFVQPVAGNPGRKDLERWKHEGIRLQEKLDLPPGAYDIRFFARDNNTNQIGTVVFPLEVK